VVPSVMVNNSRKKKKGEKEEKTKNEQKKGGKFFRFTLQRKKSNIATLVFEGHVRVVDALNSTNQSKF